MQTATETTPTASSPLPSAAPRTMRAAVRDHYGAPAVLRLDEVAVPTPGPGEVRVRVETAAATVGDHHAVTGLPYLIRLSPFGGIPRPRHRTTGMSMAGVVVAVGPGVTEHSVGDRVFGEALHGAFAEQVVVPVARIAPMPATWTFEQAAAVPWGVTALQALRDHASLSPGQRVLVIGGSGAVGSWAVQVAKALGAHVTAVCGTANVARVRELGADEVIDHRTEDFAAGGPRFDVVLDLVGARSARESVGVVVPGGVFVPCSGGGGNWLGPIARLVVLFLRARRRRVRVVPFVAAVNRADLVALAAWMQQRRLRPSVGRVFPFERLGEALENAGSGHAPGQTVVRVATASQ